MVTVKDMNTYADLESVESKAYESTWDDGLIDAFVGVSLLGLGLFWLTDYAVFGGCIPALLMPIWPRLRRQLTAPRRGLVQFREGRRNTERRKLQGLFVAGLATFVLGVVLYFALGRTGVADGDWVRIVIPGLPGVLLAVGASLAGAMIGAHRFHLYAGLLVVGASVGIWLRWEPGLYLAGAGAVVLVTGIVMVVRFVRTYPIESGAGE